MISDFLICWETLQAAMSTGNAQKGYVSVLKTSNVQFGFPKYGT